jgi:hypothetical protein
MTTPFNSREIESANNGQVAVILERLTDGSCAYGIRILDQYIPCRTLDGAMEIYQAIKQNAA